MPHIVLFLLVAGEDADLSNVGGEKMPQHGVAKAAGTSGNEQGLILENTIHLSFPSRPANAGRKK